MIYCRIEHKENKLAKQQPKIKTRFYRSQTFVAIIAFSLGMAAYSTFDHYNNPYSKVIRGSHEQITLCQEEHKREQGKLCEADGKTLMDGFYAFVPKNSNSNQTTIRLYKAGRRIGTMFYFSDMGEVSAEMPANGPTGVNPYFNTHVRTEGGEIKLILINDCFTRDNEGNCKVVFSSIASCGG